MTWKNWTAARGKGGGKGVQGYGGKGCKRCTVFQMLGTGLLGGCWEVMGKVLESRGNGEVEWRVEERAE
nr:hypothetical protein [Tanacetum cinerariifolium]